MPLPRRPLAAACRADTFRRARGPDHISATYASGIGLAARYRRAALANAALSAASRFRRARVIRDGGRILVRQHLQLAHLLHERRAAQT